MLEPRPPAGSAFDAQHWALTLAIVLGVTLYAFEGLAVITIAPRIAEALAGTAHYGWIFSGFLLASLLGAVLGGQQADRRGPAVPFALGLALFGAGLLLSGFAPDMGVFLAGRVVQGLGGGMMVTALYAAVNLAYEDALRPRVVALMSSAWVVPALVGPALAGLLAEALTWRVVFWGMTPLLLLVLLLSVPRLGRLRRERRPSGVNRLPAALLLVVGTAAFLLGLGFYPLGLLLSLAGGALALAALRRLLPEGTLELRLGLPSVVAARGLFYAAFIGVETFLALMLTGVHGLSSATTGIAIASGALSWTIGSWAQDRLERSRGPASRHQRILLGTALLVVGLSAQVAALYTPWGPLLIALAGWSLAGLGIGLAHASSSVLAFAYAPPGEEGRVSSSLQLADQFGSALSTGVGGALFALALASNGSTRTGVLLAFAFALTLAFAALLAAGRSGANRGPSAEKEVASGLWPLARGRSSDER